jgi:hypothetical protein
MEAKKHLTDLHNEHMEWIKSLQFYKDEIQLMTNRLQELVTTNSKTEILAQIEHFQNQFIRQSEVIDELKHDINQSENTIVEAVQSNPVAVNRQSAPDHIVLRDRFETFEKLFKEMKEEFNKFASKTY